MTELLRTGTSLSAALLAAQLGFAADCASRAGEKRLECAKNPGYDFGPLISAKHTS